MYSPSFYLVDICSIYVYGFDSANFMKLGMREKPCYVIFVIFQLSKCL